MQGTARPNEIATQARGAGFPPDASAISAYAFDSTRRICLIPVSPASKRSAQTQASALASRAGRAGWTGPWARATRKSISPPSALYPAITISLICLVAGSLLSRGVSGATVRALQSILGLLGFNPGPVDGQFGSLTAQAVIGFQQSQNLTMDGIVGIQSRAALTQELDLHGFVTCDY